MEEEWYSTCCAAPPLYDLHDNGEYEFLGMCMKCQDQATFELYDNNTGKPVRKVNRKEALTIFDDIFSAHLGIKKEKETK